MTFCVYFYSASSACNSEGSHSSLINETERWKDWEVLLVTATEHQLLVHADFTCNSNFCIMYSIVAHHDHPFLTAS